ncbi:sulfatase-like hydrolase/transferase [Tichowtungia aerotolerans]|uniref:Sulfatase-like hydrolase/transferase n=2 Tax=Tichowtungia aerotolerans TaxID=2697043 RepID=A0A6P1M8J8_9BACT|nr:sulfatase-like hydrolase/transferase [Tichowtungia aerotolerans]
MLPQAFAALEKRRPNVVFVFADQWRASAMGYAGDPNVKTPNFDRLAAESFNFKNAVSVCPVCSPARASMITGQYPLKHGVFVNDVYLEQDGPSIADCFNLAGYNTGYIGKWHLDGHGRSAFIPKDRRQGFQFWQALECSHNYNASEYYDNEDPEIKMWKGYDAYDQTTHAIEYIQSNRGNPFVLFLSWGPPHAPYMTAPEKFQKMYDWAKLELLPNVPESDKFIRPAGSDEYARMDPVERTRWIMAGYYAHCSALDACVGRLQTAIRDAGLEEDTIFVFTSDHGDMLGSHGLWKKQWPYDESACVPFLLKYPGFGKSGRAVKTPINTPDIMPTLLDLCGIQSPSSVQGKSRVREMNGREIPEEAVLIANVHSFGQWNAARGGKEWRGVRTARYTYVRDLRGPWLLFDNDKDPYQMNNLIGNPESVPLQKRFEELLQRKLAETDDRFLCGMDYIDQWGYVVDESGTVPYLR